MGQDPLNPDHIIFLSEGKILKTVTVKVPCSCLFEDFLGFLNVFFALVYYVNLNINFWYIFKVSNKELLGNSSDTCSTVNDRIEIKFGKLGFELVEELFRSTDIDLT